MPDVGRAQSYAYKFIVDLGFASLHLVGCLHVRGIEVWRLLAKVRT